jgi:uncharacterized membrane protein YkvA (DUF1232 family)
MAAKGEAKGIANPQLIEAMSVLLAKPTKAAESQFFKLFFESNLLVPMYSGASGGQGVVLLQSSEGSAAFPVFTDIESVTAFEPRGMNCTVLQAHKVLSSFLLGSAALLVLNPGSGVHVQIPRKELEEIAKRMHVAKKLRTTQQEAVALEREEKHKRPASARKYVLPPIVERSFRKLLHAIPEEEIAALQREVNENLKRVKRSQDKGADKKAAEALTDCSRYLLSNYAQHSAAEQALIVAAVRYFILNDDALPDSTPDVGLDDDVRVMNYVLEELGIQGKYI